MRAFLVLPIYALTVCACDNSPGSRPDLARTTPALAQVDKGTEEQRIRALEQRWRDALSKKDSMAVGQFYASDAWYLPSNSDGYHGPQEIRSRWTREFGGGGKFELAREPKKVEVADGGDMAYEVGTYQVSWDKTREHEKGHAAGNYVTVWKKENGDWKTVAYTWNRGAKE